MSQSAKNLKMELLYFQVTDLWKRFCEEHSDLFHLTCAEYAKLLRNDLDAIEQKIAEKQEVIDRINSLELARREIIKEINLELTDRKIDSVADLLEIMQNRETEKEEKHLFRFNALLIDIIERIREQNKKNQLFINKASLSLQEIQAQALGGKQYKTYTAQGGTTPSTKNININAHASKE